MLRVPALSILTSSSPAMVKMSPSLFAKPPHPISVNGALSQFNVSISGDQIQHLNTLLKILPIAALNYENSRNDRKFGSPRQWLVESVDYWYNQFDWRKQEERINSVPHFKYDVKDDDGQTYSIHFVALFSKKKDAVPILLPHGWPGSFIEYLPILLTQREKYASAPEELPYHLIAPSLVGFGFSSPPPLNKDFTVADNARILNKLMLSLGFGESGYIVQGGDIGSAVAAAMARTYDAVKEWELAIHVNFYLRRDPPASPTVADPVEKKSVERAERFLATGMAYAMLQGTRPSTAGLSLGSSPISLLAWIGEKMIEWSDPATVPSLDEILTNVSIYWFTGTYSTSIWAYRQGLSEAMGTDSKPTGKPKAVSWFPNEIACLPKSAIKEDPAVTHLYDHDKGGHFAALEVPDLLWADVEDFVAKVWKT